MAKDRNLYLIGPMGSGKSAVGRELAKLLRRKFVDTDWVLERRAKATVEDIFRTRGEKAFRKLERRAIGGVARKAGLVVALGGGAPAQPEVRKLLADTGTTVRLTCDQRVLWKRLAPEKELRPLLKAPTARESRRKLAGVIRRRKADYPKGDLRVSTTKLDPARVARAIARRLSKVPLSSFAGEDRRGG